MIPKKIHFTWFSGDQFPELVVRCMDTWREILPDYELVHWNMERISHIDNLFMRQALDKRKWAFAADLVRLYALYHEGGIYLDTDVEVFRSFDDLLSLRAFIGRENSYHVQHRRASRYLTSHCMGSEPGHPFFKSCMEYYKGRPFILSEENWLPDSLKYDQTILPFIQNEIAKLHGYNPSDRVKGIQEIDHGVKIFPSSYFDAFLQSKKSYCRHHAMGGWRGREEKGLHSVKDTLRKRAYMAYEGFFGLFGLVPFRRL